MSGTRKSVFRLLKERRMAQGKLPSEVARKSGISEIYYRKIESGERMPPPVEVMERIISALEFSDKEKEEILRFSCYERQEIPKELLEYMCLVTPASMRFINTAMKKGLPDEYFSELIRKLQLEDGLSWVPSSLRGDTEE